MDIGSNMYTLNLLSLGLVFIEQSHIFIQKIQRKINETMQQALRIQVVRLLPKLITTIWI